MPERFRSWIENQQTVVAIEQNFAGALELLARVVQSDDGGNVERPRHDRGVRSAAAQIGGEAKHILTIHRRRVRRRNVVREENVRMGQRQKILRRFPLEITDYTASDVLDVERALAQIRIVDFAESIRVMRRNFLKDELDVAKIGLEL